MAGFAMDDGVVECSKHPINGHEGPNEEDEGGGIPYLWLY